LTQYRRVTDGRTDGQTDRIAVASTALAMRSLRRAVKNYKYHCKKLSFYKKRVRPVNHTYKTAKIPNNKKASIR